MESWKEFMVGWRSPDGFRSVLGFRTESRIEAENRCDYYRQKDASQGLGGTGYTVLSRTVTVSSWEQVADDE